MLRDLKRALLAAGMILALSSFALGQDQNAQVPYGSQRGYQQGYNDGFQHGREDRNRHANRNYESDNYRRGDRGYDSNSGDRTRFAAAYREGYQAGYDDGYNGRNARNDAYGREGYGRDNRNRRGGYGSNNVAYDNGYRDGVNGARSDMRENKRFDYNDHGWYQEADRGYSMRYGNKETYRQQYRQGYEAGYRETFGQQGPGYGSGRYGNDRRGSSDAAYSNGYQDGIVGAQKDMADRTSPDPTRHDWYKEANRGYDGRYGSPQDYKQRYRQGYEAGYRETFGQQGPGYGSGRYGNDRRGNFDAAYSAGYEDGIVGAREDMHGRNSSDPTRHGWYKEANRGYNGRYGSPQDYKERYRQGYIAGYNATYRKQW